MANGVRKRQVPSKAASISTEPPADDSRAEIVHAVAAEETGEGGVSLSAGRRDLQLLHSHRVEEPHDGPGGGRGGCVSCAGEGHSAPRKVNGRDSCKRYLTRRGAPRVPRAARQRAAFYNLSYVNLPTGLTPDSDAYNEQLALAIFQTNAVAAGRQGVGIFPRMARLNHGCSRAFDVVYTWRDDEGALVVHALKPIRAGEELLTTYTNTKRPRHVRREFLQEHYGFECQCAVCSLPDDLSAQSDERLNAVSDLYTRFSRWQHQLISGSEAAAAAISIWRLGEEEGYWSERGQLASDVTHVACAHSDAAAAREWARLAQRWYGYELGADSVQAREMGRVAQEPQLHAAWGTRQRETVRGPERWMIL